MKRSFFILAKKISNFSKSRNLKENVINIENITNPWSGKPLNKKTNLDNTKIQNMLPEVIDNFFK